jgi:hypothetical protein
MAREHTLKIQLSDEELGHLDELRGGVPRAVYVRQLIHKPPEVKDVATYEEALAILTSMARDGKVRRSPRRAIPPMSSTSSSGPHE